MPTALQKLMMFVVLTLAAKAFAGPDPEAQTPALNALPLEIPPLGAARQTDAHFKRLVEALRSDESYKVRVQAAIFLGRSEDERAFDPLVAALANDPHYTVRASSATALSNLQDPRAISHLIKAVALDSDPFVRQEATSSLAKFDREEALPYVVATYGSDSDSVRKQAVSYLAEAPDQAAKQVLIRALGDAEEIFEVAQSTALKMPPTEVQGFLRQALDYRDAGVRRGAIRVLRTIGTADAAQIILEVHERDIEADAVRTETKSALRSLGNFLDKSKIVHEATQNPQKHARAKALKLLGVIGGPEAVKILSEAALDQDPYLRGTAVMAMADLGDQSMIPILEKLEADPANQRIVHLVRHTLKQLRKKTDE